MDTDYSDLFSSLGYVSDAAHRAFTGTLNRRFAENGIDITYEQWAVLIMLWQWDGQTQDELSQKLLLEKSTISRLLNTLEHKGLVRRLTDTEDRRKNRIHYTEKSAVLRERCTPILRKIISDGLDGLSTEALETCAAVMMRIRTNLMGEESP